MTGDTEGRPYRVLVTGSRDWTDGDVIEMALRQALPEDRVAILVHGKCRGADLIARDIWRSWGLTDEPHPAFWHRGGGFDPTAGYRRNVEMVQTRPDACRAFIMPCSSPRCRRTDPHGSHGATHCAGLAEKAGIETHIWEIVD